jgi:hypothetical protein
MNDPNWACEWSIVPDPDGSCPDDEVDCEHQDDQVAEAFQVEPMFFSSQDEAQSTVARSRRVDDGDSR